MIDTENPEENSRFVTFRECAGYHGDHEVRIVKLEQWYKIILFLLASNLFASIVTAAKAVFGH